MKISILTLFKEMFQGVFEHSILKLAQEKKVISIEFINIRDFGIGKHKIVDDTPYGGGVGMVMRVDVLKKAIDKARCKVTKSQKCLEKIILLDPQGKKYTQACAKELTTFNHLILLCGRYEGVDDRIRTFIDEEISVGDYILTGGEIPAMTIIDSVTRLLPKALGKDESSQDESFSNHTLLEYPHYTRPQEYQGLSIPKILLSGNHKKIAKWREEKAIECTKNKRPDLLKS